MTFPFIGRHRAGGRAFLALVGLFLTLAIPGQAHHGIVNFDLNTEIEIEGVIERADFLNPHSWLYIEAQDENGETVTWRCEMRGATVLRRSGWSPDMFEPGMPVTVTAAPDRTDPHSCYLGSVTFADGRSVARYEQLDTDADDPLGDRPLTRENGDPNLAGDWAAEQRVLTDPKGFAGAFLPVSVAQKLEPGAVPEGTRAFPGARGTPEAEAENPKEAAWSWRQRPVTLTTAGKTAIKGFDPATTDNPRLRCEPTSIIFDWWFDFMVNRIVQTEDTITLKYGFMGMERTIHLDMDKHPDDLTPTRTGHSIGRWEDDTLIVDTVGFEPGILWADNRTPHSGELHVVERFTLGPEGKKLTREYVAEDPLYFEGQYTGMDTMYPADVSYQPYECEDRSHGTIGDPTAAAAEPEEDDSPWWMFWK